MYNPTDDSLAKSEVIAGEEGVSDKDGDGDEDNDSEKAEDKAPDGGAFFDG